VGYPDTARDYPPCEVARSPGSRGAQVGFVLDGSDPTVASSALSSANLIGQVEGATLQQQALARRGGGLSIVSPLQVRTRVWYNPDMVSVVFMVPALIGIILQMQATLLTSSAIVRERERGTIEQLIVTPIRSWGRPGHAAGPHRERDPTVLGLSN